VEEDERNGTRDGHDGRVSGDRTLLRRGFTYVGEYLRAEPLVLGASIAGSVIFAAFSVLATVVLGHVIDDLLIPYFEGTGPEDSTTTTVLGAVAVVALFRSASVIARRFFGGMGTARTKRGLQRRVSDRLFSIPLDRLRRTPTGHLLAHIDSDAEASSEPLMPLPFSLGALSILVFAFAALFAVDPALAVVGAVLLPVIALMQRVFGFYVEEPSIRVRHDIGHVSSVAHESFDGAIIVKTLGRGAAEERRFSEATDQLRRSRIEQSTVRAVYEQALAVLPDIGVVVLLLVGASRIGSGAITTGELVQSVALFGILSFPVRVLGYFFASVPTGTVARDRLERFFGEPDDPLLEAGAAMLPQGPLSVEVRGLRVAVGEALLLDGIDLDVPPGQTVALVGSTGSGKSTLVRSIARLIEGEGTIRLAGTEIHDIDGTSLRDRMALALQEPFLFADSIDENVRLGLAIDPAERDRAAAIAGADHFVNSLPHGFDTVVGERGVTLSGGQRQRVALTRALARRPGLLLLDDATSAVDPVVETAILDRLGSQRATVLVVAQRLSTIRLADRVVYLTDGRIAATGSHAELLDRPDYAALVQAYEMAGGPAS